MTSPGRIAQLVRVGVVPRLFPVLARSTSFRRLMFRTVSQTAVHYRASPLSEGRAGRVRGGDRLPWVMAEEPGAERADNFAPLTSLDWQVHVYGGEAAAGLAELCGRRDLALHVFPWSASARRSGLRRGAAYLVRPDGYVALADPNSDPAKLERYLERRGVCPLNTAGMAGARERSRLTDASAGLRR